MVYFSPSSDPFQPVPEVLEMAYDVFRFLFEWGLGWHSSLRGGFPSGTATCWPRMHQLVQGRVGLITLDPGVAATFEPHAARPEDRLAQAAELIGAHIPVEARLDPILPGVTDGADCLEPLCGGTGPRRRAEIAASVLFLRPAVVGSLRRHVKDKLLVNRLLDRFAAAEPLAIHAGNSRVRAVPASARLEIVARLKSIAHRHGLEVLACACKNPDISAGSCHISGRRPGATRRGSQLGMFQP